MALCGVCSRPPTLPPNWAGGSFAPPKPAPGGPVKFVIAMAALLDVTRGESWKPLAIALLRRGEGRNSGFGELSGPGLWPDVLA